MQTMTILKSVAVCVLGLLLPAGCAHLEAQPLSPETTAAQFDARSTIRD